MKREHFIISIELSKRYYVVENSKKNIIEHDGEVWVDIPYQRLEELTKMSRKDIFVVCETLSHLKIINVVILGMVHYYRIK